MDLQMVSLRSTTFYTYDGETLKQTGELPDFSAHSSMFDGHGRVISAKESKDFQNWFRDLVFRLDDDKLGHIQFQTSTGKKVWYTVGDEYVDYSSFFDGLIVYD